MTESPQDAHPTIAVGLLAIILGLWSPRLIRLVASDDSLRSSAELSWWLIVLALPVTALAVAAAVSAVIRRNRRALVVAVGAVAAGLGLMATLPPVVS